AVHGELERFKPIELVARCPVRDEVGVCNQNAGRMRERSKHPDRLSRLHEQGLVVREVLQRMNDCVKCIPASRGSARSAIDDQLAWVLCDVFVEIVHQHPHCGFLMPTFAGNGCSSWRSNGCVFDHYLASPINSVSFMIPSMCSMSVANTRSTETCEM